VLGLQPTLGREFRREEDRNGTQPVAMIGYSLWQERFGGSAQAIGSTLVANGRGYTVVGVLPAQFRFSDERQILTPLGQNDTISMQKRDLYWGIHAVARLKPGVTLKRADAELKAIGRRLASEYPDTNRNMTFGAEPLKQQVIGDVGATLFLLAGAVAMVLLIASANVANLFLARSLSRAREFAIRAALGAGRGRLIRQLLTESVLLGLAGGAMGLGLAAGATGWALRHMPGWLPRTEEVTLDGRVLLFTAAASVLTGIAFGLVPALRQQFNLESGLRQGARGTSRGIRRLQSSFVIAELALALVLLSGAGLMMRTILRLWAVNPGFNTQGLLVMTVGLSPKTADSPALIRTAWQQIVERVRSTPGVEAAALDSIVPLSGDNQSLAYWTSAEKSPPKDAPFAEMYSPTPDYLRTMKIPLLRGRFFTERDRIGTQPVIVIDETMVKRVFPGKDPVGSELSIQLLGRVRIVGVVGAVKHQSLDESAYQQPMAAIYLPFLQFPDEFMRLTQGGMNLLVRTSISPVSLIQAIKQSVLGPARDQPVRDVLTMEQLIGASIGKRRGMLMLLGIFAGVALVLASIGIYGVISYSLSRRVQEIGIRMALGAQPGQVLRLIVRQAMGMVLIGIAAGTAASLGLTRLIAKLLYGVSPTDPVTFGAVIATLCMVAVAAVWIPARRAARIDPVIALRYE
jgi:predicted permease